MTMEYTLSMYQTNSVWFRVTFGNETYHTLDMDSVRDNGHAMLSVLHNAYLSTHNIPVTLRRI